MKKKKNLKDVRNNYFEEKKKFIWLWKVKKIILIVEFVLFIIVFWVVGFNIFFSFGVIVLIIIWIRFVIIWFFEVKFGVVFLGKNINKIIYILNNWLKEY